MAVGSFSAGLSGLNANSTYLSVIGNNLANINTLGYKASTVSFMDLVSQNVGGTSINPMQVGLGVTTGSISPTFSQGSIEANREPTNAAIQGAGFFVVQDPNTGENVYTRAGNFSVNSNGELVTPDGYSVQGYTTVDPTTQEVVTTGQTTAIVVPPGVLRQPVATTQFSTTTNLSSQDAVGTEFSHSFQIFDSLGARHVVTITYTKTAAQSWTADITVPAADLGGTVTDPPTSILPAPLQLVFDAAGQLATVNGAAPADQTITVATPWANGAAASTLTWDLVDAANRTNLTAVQTERTATFSATQNGSEASEIREISIDKTGSIIATSASGTTFVIAKIALANFNNPKGLVKVGSNKFGESEAAGIPNVGAPGTGGRGTLIGSAVEQSNVDIATEFTQMILAQRGYQANAKTITVSDEILVDTLALKR
jgi:flagellar hook protein FlgE